MINTVLTLYSSLKAYYNNLSIYGHSYDNKKLLILKGTLDVLKEIRTYKKISVQDLTDLYSIVEYIVNSSEIFKKEYRPTNNYTSYFEDVPIQFYPKGIYNSKESLVTILANTTAFKYNSDNIPWPNKINLKAIAYNFTPSDSAPRKWEYSNGQDWNIIENENTDELSITPNSKEWNKLDMISVRHTIYDKYTNQITLLKVRDGYSSYSVDIISTNGEIFQNNKIDTDLIANVSLAGKDISSSILNENYSWTRTSSYTEEDVIWNNKNIKGRTIKITDEDVKRKAVFNCSVLVDNEIEIVGQKTIIDQQDTINLSSVITSNQSLIQLYNKDSGVNIPNWTESPFLKLTPTIISSLTEENILETEKDNLSNIEWRKNNILIENSSTHIIDNNYILTIKTNELALNPNIKYELKGNYKDPVTGAILDFAANISFVRVETSGSTIQAIMTQPLGNVFKNDDIAFLKAHCDLYRGSEIDNTLILYSWFIEMPGIFSPKRTTQSSPKGDTTIELNNIDGILRDSIININGVNYTITNVQSNKTVTITPALLDVVEINSTVYNPNYNEDAGEGWALISSSNTFGGITGYTTNEINIPEDSVLNYATFKCIIKDTDPESFTNNKSVFATASFLDQQDPIQIGFDTPEGTILRNSKGSLTVGAEVWRNGEEIDKSGALYNYSWIQYDQYGIVIPEFSKSSKTIILTSEDIDTKSNFEVSLKTKANVIIAKGRITLSTLDDGSSSVIIYSRDQLKPTLPIGVNPPSWVTNSKLLDTWWGILWQSFNVTNLAGEQTGEWSVPVMSEPYNSNMLNRFKWFAGSGDTTKYIQYGTNANNIRSNEENPFKSLDILWKCITTSSENFNGGFNIPNIPIYKDFKYRYSIWVKQSQKDGTVYFGCDPKTLLASGATDNTGLFWAGDLPETNKWYLLVGYINAYNDNSLGEINSGVYDPQTGRKVSTSSFKTFKFQNEELQDFRIYQGYSLGIGSEIKLWGSRIDVCDSREPSITELLKQAAIGQSGYSVSLSNESHTVLSDSEGNLLENESGINSQANCSFLAFEGTKELLPTNIDPLEGYYKWDISSIDTTKGLVLKKKDDNSVYLESMSKDIDSGICTIIFNCENSVILKKQISITKSKQGSNGEPAKRVILIGDQVFKYKADFTGTPQPEKIELSVQTENIIPSSYLWYYKNKLSDQWIQLVNSTNILLVDPTKSDLGWSPNIESVSYKIVVNGFIDIKTIIKLTDGKSGDYVIMSFKKSTTKPTDFPTNISGTGNNWVDSPSGEGVWWMTKNTVDGHTKTLKGTWSDPVKTTSEDGSGIDFKFAKSANSNVIPAFDSAPTNPLSPSLNNIWKDTPEIIYGLEQMWISQINVDPKMKPLEGALWTSPFRMTAENGNWVTFIFKSSPTIPQTPTFSTPYPPLNSGWIDAPTNATDIWWMSKGTVDGATDTITADGWSIPVKTVGETGKDGKDGIWTDFMYAIGYDTPSGRPIITNPTGKNPGPGWNDEPITIPINQFLWMTQVLKDIATNNVVSGETWSMPVKISGEKGSTGNPGSDGSDGKDGDYTTFVFKVFTDTSSVTRPVGNLTSPNGTPSGWLDSPSDITSKFWYMSSALISGIDSKTVVGDWTMPLKAMAEDGKDGVGGIWLDFKYQNSTASPAVSNIGGPDDPDSSNTKWSDTAQTPPKGQFIWMTQAKRDVETNILKSTWATPAKISSEDGKDGTNGNDSYSCAADKENHILLATYPNTIDKDEIGNPMKNSTLFTVLKGTSPLTYYGNNPNPGKGNYSIKIETLPAGIQVEVHSSGRVFCTAFDGMQNSITVLLKVYCEEASASFLKQITWTKKNVENFYIEDALKSDTVVQNGLILTNTIRLGKVKKQDEFSATLEYEKAGIYGGLEQSDPNKTVRFYSGGTLQSAIEYASSLTPSPNGSTFVVRQDGTLLASNVKLTGDITATSGTFTGNINANGGKIGNLKINADGSFGQVDSNFYVSPDGSVTALNGTFTGVVTATEGSKIGILTLDPKGIKIQNSEFFRSASINIGEYSKSSDQSVLNFGILVKDRNGNEIFQIGTENINTSSFNTRFEIGCSTILRGSLVCQNSMDLWGNLTFNYTSRIASAYTDVAVHNGGTFNITTSFCKLVRSGRNAVYINLKGYTIGQLTIFYNPADYGIIFNGFDMVNERTYELQKKAYVLLMWNGTQWIPPSAISENV